NGISFARRHTALSSEENRGGKLVAIQMLHSGIHFWKPSYRSRGEMESPPVIRFSASSSNWAESEVSEVAMNRMPRSWCRSWGGAPSRLARKVEAGAVFA